nr:MAG TPA: hypothetical protein [Caudoviricetes sp.]
MQIVESVCSCLTVAYAHAKIRPQQAPRQPPDASQSPDRGERRTDT